MIRPVGYFITIFKGKMVYHNLTANQVYLTRKKMKISFPADSHHANLKKADKMLRTNREADRQ